MNELAPPVPPVPARTAPRPHRPHVRSPVDVLRLIVGLVLMLGGIATANLLDSALLGLSEDGSDAIAGLPGWAQDLPAATLAVGVIAGVGSALVWALVTTRFRRFALLAVGFAGAAGLSVALGELIYELVDEPVRRAFFTDVPAFRLRGWEDELRPGDPLLAGSVAMLAVAASFLRNAIVRRLSVLLALYAAISVLAAGVPAISLIADIGSGIFVASVLLLLFGRNDLSPDALDISQALQSIGLELDDLRHVPVDAERSVPWEGTGPTGDRVFVKALGRDERSADLLFRAYRWIRLRKTGDHRPFVSLRRSVEHEALVSLQAAALGIRTPKILGVTDAGIDGMVIAYEAIDGVTADQVDDIDDDVLPAIWSMVSALHAKRIAHRDLQLANLLLDSDNRPWLIDFGFAQLAASDQPLGTDVAELLASTAAVVGPDRAVAAAHETAGRDELERAMPWLQPLALSSATRTDVGGAKGLEPIRTLLVDQCGVPAEEPVKLERVSGKTLFVLATIGLSAYFLVPQLADFDDVWAQAKDASVPWAGIAVGFSFLTYVAATAALLGAIPIRLRFGPALLAQLASSFANRVTPAKVGGFATNIRYFQRQGVATAISVSAVGINAVAGIVVHLLLTLAFLLLASGNRGSNGVPIPSTRSILLALVVAVALVGVSVALPYSRRLLTTRVLPQLRTGWSAIREISRSPGRLALLFGGSAVITLSYLAAMVASLEAFGSTAALPIVGLLFLTASAVASAAPTPGGLGAAEAALIAAFSTIENASTVVPAVFLYRFVTFWLPILPGWAALTYLRATDRL